MATSNVDKTCLLEKLQLFSTEAKGINRCAYYLYCPHFIWHRNLVIFHSMHLFSTTLHHRYFGSVVFACKNTLATGWSSFDREQYRKKKVRKEPSLAKRCEKSVKDAKRDKFHEITGNVM